MKKILKSVFILLTVASLAVGATYAAFTSKATVTGNTFSTGNTDLKLLIDLVGNNTDPGNLTDNLPGVDFDNIYPDWTEDYAAKVANVGTLNMTLQNIAEYVSGDTDFDPHIQVEIYRWDDGNLDGIVDPGELIGGPYGVGTLEEWKLAGPGTPPSNPDLFQDLGQINVVNEIRGFVFRFTAASDIPDTMQGKTEVLDFVFTGTTDLAPQP